MPGTAAHLISALITFIFFFFILPPLVGVVTRFRINFTPKGVGLGDVEEGDSGNQQRLSQDMRVGPVVNSIWAMITRVKQIEGWQGLYKGTMPILITGAAQNLVAFVVLSGATSHPRYAIESGGIIRSIIWGLVVVTCEIPRQVLLNRAITTPHKLGWFAPRVAIRALFTPYERQRPWRLYATPGLALGQILHVLYLLTVVRGARALLVPSYRPGFYGIGGAFSSFWSFMGLFLYILFLCLSFIVLTPLEVLSARLSVQRNHPADGEVPPAESGLEFAGEEEDVIGLRDEAQPYESLFDAMKKIVDEEGWATLYRAFYLTLAGTLLVGFS